jgi:hypothetical protein
MTPSDLADLRYFIRGLRAGVDANSVPLCEHYCECLELLLRELDPASETVAARNHLEPNRNGDGR